MVHTINSRILNILEFCFFIIYVFWISYLVAPKMLKCLLHQTAVNAWNSSFYCAYVFCYRTDWTENCKKHLIRNYSHDKVQKPWMICTVKRFLTMGSTVPRFKIRTVHWSPEHIYVHSLVDKMKWFYENARCYNKIYNKIYTQNTVCDTLSICQFDVCTCMFQRIFLAFCI